MMDRQFELLVETPTAKTRKTVQWSGSDAENAARRYVDCHRDHVVVATRPANRHGLFVLGGGTIIG